MTATRIGLMGFGRIGRNMFRLLHGREDIVVAAINDVADPEALTYLLKYDSMYGRFPGKLSYSDGALDHDGRPVLFGTAMTPADTDWAAADVDIVFDTTSRYRTKETLQGHLDSGARHVVLTSSPEVPGDLPLLLRGVNDDILDSTPPIVAMGSNTANAAAPILQALDQEFGLNRVFMTTVKAMSKSGRLADVPSDSFRTSRSAAENIIPSETNSGEIITQVLPHLKDRLLVTSMNVPVADGSTVDMVAEVGRETTVDEVNNAVEKAIGAIPEVIEFVADPIVSSDVRMNSHSGVFDSLATMVTGGTLVKTVTWFNNGWGYSHRVVEVAQRIAGGAE